MDMMAQFENDHDSFQIGAGALHKGSAPQETKAA
jgi:hypothetical protein